MRSISLNQRLGKNIRRLRQKAGLSQEALADRCELHRTYIGAVERGERNVTLLTVEKIATALDVDPIVLLQEPQP